MVKAPKVTIAAAKSKHIKSRTGGSGGGNNGLKKVTVMYIPRQVLMKDRAIKPAPSHPSKDNTNICSTEASSISKMNEMFNTENPKSTTDQSWSPLMDGIVTDVPPHLTANCSLANRTATAKDPKKVDVGLATKALDEYIDKVLYGPKRTPLPAFEKICRE